MALGHHKATQFARPYKRISSKFPVSSSNWRGLPNCRSNDAKASGTPIWVRNINQTNPTRDFGYDILFKFSSLHPVLKIHGLSTNKNWVPAKDQVFFPRPFENLKVKKTLRREEKLFRALWISSAWNACFPYKFKVERRDLRKCPIRLVLPLFS